MVPDTKHAIAVLGAVANSFVLFAILLQLVVTQMDSSSTAAMDFEENKMSPKLAEKKEDFHTKDSLIRVLERQVYASWDSHVAVFMPASLRKVSSFGIRSFNSYVTS